MWLLESVDFLHIAEDDIETGLDHKTFDYEPVAAFEFKVTDYHGHG